MDACNAAGRIKLKKVCVIASLISNLGILCLFKYTNFILENLDAILSHLGIGMIDNRLDLLLPVGISFYTFQALSYSIDVYRGEVEAERNVLKYALFVSFFHNLLPGPLNVRPVCSARFQI